MDLLERFVKEFKNRRMNMSMGCDDESHYPEMVDDTYDSYVSYDDVLSFLESFTNGNEDE